MKFGVDPPRGFSQKKTFDDRDDFDGHTRFYKRLPYVTYDFQDSLHSCEFMTWTLDLLSSFPYTLACLVASISHLIIQLQL